MDEPTWSKSWQAFARGLAHPAPSLLILAVIVGFALYSSRHGGLNIPAPPIYPTSSGASACAAQSVGAAYCQELAIAGQRHSFVLTWVGWLLTIAGSLFAGAMALREDPVSSETNPLFSAKHRALLLASLGGAIAAIGAQTIQRGSDAAQAAADATQVLGELAVVSVNERDGGVVEGAGVTAAEGPVADGAVEATLAPTPGPCKPGLTPDQLAFQHCTQVKAHWLSGRAATSFLDNWKAAAAKRSHWPRSRMSPREFHGKSGVLQIEMRSERTRLGDKRLDRRLSVKTIVTGLASARSGARPVMEPAVGWGREARAIVERRDTGAIVRSR